MATDRLDSIVVPAQSAFRTAVAGLIGNVLEWFDFAVYGYFASDIGRQFFPGSSPTAQQLLALAVFALGFFARPAGSLVLGMVGDRIGRRALRDRGRTPSGIDRGGPRRTAWGTSSS